MDIDDNDFLIVRKNLNILSVLILILGYTNAKLHSMNFLGIELDLNGSKLYIALLLGYIYFVWRFLTKLPFISGFKNDFDQYYLNSEKGIKKSHSYERYKNILINSSKELKTIIENKRGYGLNHLAITRFDAATYRKLNLSFSLYTIEVDNTKSSFEVVHKITVSSLLFSKILIIFCVKYDKFGDYLFPLVLVVLNIIFFIFRPEWQGSFYSLFLS